MAVSPTVFHTWGDFVFLAVNGPYDDVAPGNRTDYWYTSDPKLSVWQNTYGAHSGCLCTAPIVAGPRLKTRPGGQVTEAWNKEARCPLRPRATSRPPA